MAVKCANCGGAHPVWNCSKPTKSEEALQRPSSRQASKVPAEVVVAPYSEHPKPKMGRPRTGYIKAEYNRKYMQDKRKADKLGITVKELREKEKGR